MQLAWIQNDTSHTALWRSERGAPPPKQVQLVDDTLNADTAYRLACEGAALLWQGDFQNARQLLQALARRLDNTAEQKKIKLLKLEAKLEAKLQAKIKLPENQPSANQAQPTSTALAFHQYRQQQAQRARVLGSLLIPLTADYRIALRRAPDVRVACEQVWGDAQALSENDLTTIHSVVSLRELMGMSSAAEWRKKGVEIAVLNNEPYNRIHPHYGVFSPVRGEYIQLLAQAPLAKNLYASAFDIGTGTGILAAVLAIRGVKKIIATELDTRALACAQENITKLGLTAQIEVQQHDLFPKNMQADLIVCNPPWLPARATTPLERAVYDENSQMLRGFLAGLKNHLKPKGEGWLIISDLAEHLGLRTRDELSSWIAHAGLKVLGRTSTQAQHPKVLNTEDALHTARAAEVTSLWRLAVI